MKLKPIMVKYLLLITAIVFFCGCTTIYNPATERNETLLINTANEVSMGKEMVVEVRKKMKVLVDPVRQRRLDSIAKRVARVSDRLDLEYHFGIVNDKEFNAFALPGGFIYVNSGLIDAATDDELACVIGHEIGHVAARHSVKQLQTALGYQLVINIALGLSGQQTMGKAMDIVYNLISLGYSRKDELLADKLAVRYAKKSGFNPYGMVTFFEKLKKESATGPTHYNPVFLSSHPAIDQRIENVRNEIALQKS
jgi:beta-barrel assembly-enhancing protease